jgi:SAM-dependent methyltransferase
MSEPISTTWGQGEVYDRYMGRWSRPVALDFLAWLAAPAGLRWLDVGCGTGALAEAILSHAAPAQVTGVDPAAGFVEHARRSVVDSRAQFEIGDAQRLRLDDQSFDSVVSGLALNFVPDPAKALGEMSRVARRGGVVAVYVWDYAGRMEFLRRFWDAAVALREEAGAHDEGRRFPLCREDALAEAARGARLADVATHAIEVATDFTDFDDYWTPFLSGQAPAPGYVATLSAADREALRECLRATLPTGTDGSIRLVARAWAVRGRV